MITGRKIAGIALISLSALPGLLSVLSLGIRCGPVGGLPLCSQIQQQALALAVGAAILLSIGIAVLAATKERVLKAVEARQQVAKARQQEAPPRPFEFWFYSALITFAIWSALTIQVTYFPINCELPPPPACVDLKILLGGVSLGSLFATFIFIFVSLWGLRKDFLSEMAQKRGR